MRYEFMFPSEFVKAADLAGKDVTVTIKSVTMDELTMRGGRKENKGVIRFEKAEKKLVLNRTNADTIAAIYGKDTDDWIGKKITMYPTTTTFGRDTVECIRIRTKQEMEHK